VTAIKVSVMSGMLLMLAGITLFAAIVMGFAALWAFARPSLGSAGASLVVAGALATLTLIFLLGSWLVTRRGKAPPPPPAAIYRDPTEAITQTITALFSNNKLSILLATLIAGVVAEHTARRK
jgi:hypothetical protein